VKLWMLGSGSSGNAVLLETDNTRIVIDAGFGARTLAHRLKAIKIPPQSIQACIVTHEHNDHVQGARSAMMRWGWAVYATRGTAHEAAELADVPVRYFATGETFSVGHFDIRAAAVPHDATDPVGLLVTARSTGARAAICYDIGHVSKAVRTLCEEVDLLVLEANHDEGMLRAGPYPPFLQQRIASAVGHLSNRAAGALCADVAGRQLGQIVLAHLSEANNTPQMAHRAVSNALRRTAFRGGLTLAKQNCVVGPFVPKGSKRNDPLQYSLF
jgi:phosphoribosyl 1,2-cyclic phosphodiesterase